jgi:hypothetical protein
LGASAGVVVVVVGFAGSDASAASAVILTLP